MEMSSIDSTADAEKFFPGQRKRIAQLFDETVRATDTAGRAQKFCEQLSARREVVPADARHAESAEFARMRAESGPEELQRLRSAVEFVEAMAPTRPYSGIEPATTCVPAGSSAAMADRAEDSTTERRR